MFVIVRNLAVPVHLGTSAIDKFVKGSFRSKRKIVPFKSAPVPTLMVNETETDKTEE